MFRPRRNILRDWGRSVFSTFIRYDSKEGPAQKHASPRGDTLVHFLNEQVIVIIKQDEHRVDFYDADEQYLRSADLPRCEGGREVYMDVRCAAEGDEVILEFPVYRWTDHYPHCDGESDRWTTQILGWHTMRYVRAENAVSTQLHDFT